MSKSSTAAAASFGTAILASSVTQGIGVPAFFIFLALKLGLGDTTVEQWSWWNVTAPLWGGALLTVAFLVAAAIAGFVHLTRD